MAIINIFNKGKRGKKTPGAAKKPEKAKTAKKPAEAKNAVRSTVVAKENASLYRLIKNPHITEKATKLAEMNQYIFKVDGNANKQEIKKIIEDFYGVKVTGVRTATIPSRIKKRGKGVAIKQGYKKAMVVVAKGQKIEVLPR